MSVWKKAIGSILAIAICLFGYLFTVPVFAEGENDNKCIETAILGEGGKYCENGNGSGVSDILLTVIDILSAGIGILGILGITIVGIQYLTAGGSEEKTKKAKQRMLEIVIGLVAYVLIYALLKWLLPGFSLPSKTKNTSVILEYYAAALNCL